MNIVYNFFFLIEEWHFNVFIYCGKICCTIIGIYAFSIANNNTRASSCFFFTSFKYTRVIPFQSGFLLNKHRVPWDFLIERIFSKQNTKLFWAV